MPKREREIFHISFKIVVVVVAAFYCYIIYILAVTNLLLAFHSVERICFKIDASYRFRLYC